MHVSRLIPGNLRLAWLAVLALPVCLSSGCAVSHKTAVKPPATTQPTLTASRQDLIARYNAIASGCASLNATANLQLTAGSSYSGVIEQYHEVKSFILASRPSSIRVIGQAPVVGKDIFDMVSDGQTFEIFIPSKNQFITGPTDFDRKASKPVENLRPQHILDALFWSPISSHAIVLLEQTNDPAPLYVLVVARLADPKDPDSWRLLEKISFDRSDLFVSRIQTYSGDGLEISDVELSQWQPEGALSYPRQVLLSRPSDDYHLRISITKLGLNETIAPDKFHLAQPGGSRLVRVGPDAEESHP